MATPIVLSEDERRTLECWVRASTSEQRLALRARIILAAGEGKASTDIASALLIRRGTASKWRTRFAQSGLCGLWDRPRSGKPAIYDRNTECRILSKLDEPPPSGYAAWNGRLIAQALGDVSTDHVWRVLRRRGIALARREGWCISRGSRVQRKSCRRCGALLGSSRGRRGHLRGREAEHPGVGASAGVAETPERQGHHWLLA